MIAVQGVLVIDADVGDVRFGLSLEPTGREPMQRTSCCIHPSLVEYRSILFEEYDGTALMIALDELPFREQRGTFVGDIDARADHEGHAATQPAGRDRRHVDLAAGDADRTLGESPCLCHRRAWTSPTHPTSRWD